MAPWLLYGATGYTGQLVLAAARAAGERPVVAGRRAEAVRVLAQDLPWRAFEASAPDLSGVSAVLSCAGPFSATAAPMVEACLRQGVHYLDVTGEVRVFEAIFARDAEARARRVTLLPGVGYDVVPSDALAQRLAQSLPGATHLELAIMAPGGITRGTTRSALEQLGQGLERVDGVLRPAPLAGKRIVARFADKPRSCVSVPTGDLVTAWHTTGIPNIATYFSARPRLGLMLRVMDRAAPLVRRAQPLLDRWVARQPAGPSEATRARTVSQLWGRVRRGDETVEDTLTVENAYDFTARSALHFVRLAARGALPVGAVSPARTGQLPL